MTKYKIIFFGGDRLLENGPLSKLSLFLKKKKNKIFNNYRSFTFKKKS